MSLNRNQIDCEHRSTFLLKRSLRLWEKKNNPKNDMNSIFEFFFLYFIYIHFTCSRSMHDECKFSRRKSTFSLSLLLSSNDQTHKFCAHSFLRFFLLNGIKTAETNTGLNLEREKMYLKYTKIGV